MKNLLLITLLFALSCSKDEVDMSQCPAQLQELRRLENEWNEARSATPQQLGISYSDWQNLVKSSKDRYDRRKLMVEQNFPQCL